MDNRWTLDNECDIIVSVGSKNHNCPVCVLIFLVRYKVEGWLYDVKEFEITSGILK